MEPLTQQQLIEQNIADIKDQMRDHVGTKHVKLFPMTRGEYNLFRGWNMPEDENPHDPGYMVQYMDQPVNINVPGFDGYISWSPKPTADEAYIPIDHPDIVEAISSLRNEGFILILPTPQGLQKIMDKL